MVDTSDEWIMTRIGVRERHILKGEGLGSSYMAIRAVNELLRKTDTDPLSVDLLICATVTPDMFFPSTATLTAGGAGMKNAFAYDLSAACSSFLFSLSTASQFIETGRYKKIIVVGADKMSSITDYTDRATCPIFGDGAAAVMLEPNNEGMGILDFDLHSDGMGAPHLHMKGGGSCYPPTHETVDKKMHYIYQEGQVVFKAAVTNMSNVSLNMMKRNNLSADDVAYLVPHQANMRIIEATAHHMGLPTDKAMVNIQNYGNMTSATIPMVLRDYESKLKKGDNLILATFGGGFTWGAAWVKWAY